MKNIFVILFVLGFYGNSAAQDLNALRQKHFNLEKSIALQGFDPVSYFVGTSPKRGTAAYAFNYGNVIYYFNSQTNLDAFKLNPAKYEPQYGGWCAYAMGATGEKVEIDPKTFKIINGKLYLFYNSFFNNTLKTWNTKEAILLPKSVSNWKNIFK